jgi:leader peptidase (prepilin peptidase)/N-methyltransferase
MTELTSIYYLVIACFLIVIFIYDLKHYIIPDQVIYPAIVLVFLYNIYQFAINNQQLTINNFLSAFGAAAFFLTIVLISRGKWMGIGDIKLAFFMGLFLGFPDILVALFLAFLIGAAVGLILIALGKKTLKSEVPFGPFLVTGTFLALFWGEKMIDIYFNCFSLK